MAQYTLYMSLRSPFARRIRLILEELKAPYTTEVLDVFNTPLKYLQINPLARVPSLKLPNGEVLIDSNIILKYLSEKYFDHPLFQSRGGKNNYYANLSALSVGIMEWTVTWFLESIKPKSQQDSSTLEEADAAIIRTMHYLNSDLQNKIDLNTTTNLENIGYWDLDLGAALGYVHFRMKHIQFNKYPNLNNYYELLMQRESFKISMPVQS